MIEIVQHIESLLLENNCVIIPGFGGFVAQYSPARWIKEEGQFLPPTRTVGFNPQLKINDGLLVQSYMQVYNTSFPDASKMVDKAVTELMETLHTDGKMEFHGIGVLTLSMNETFDFHPYEDGIMTPELYGLSSFDITEWEDLIPAKEEIVLVPEKSRSKEVYEIRINRSLLRHTVAAAAAIVIFFFMSTPAENTYIEKEDYAQLMSLNIFETIGSHVVTANNHSAQQGTSKKNPKAKVQSPRKSTNLKPRVVRVEKVQKTSATAVSPKKEEIKDVTAKPVQPIARTNSQVAKNQNGSYHIIIASVANSAEARKAVENLKKK